MSNRGHPADLVSAIIELTGEVRAMRLAVEGPRYRDKLLVRLSAAIGLGPTWAGAQALALVLAGAEEAPPGLEPIAAALRADASCPRSQRQLYRVIEAASKAVATDRNREVCQWPPIGSNPSSPPDDRTET